MNLSRQDFVLRYWNQECSPPPTTPLRSAIVGGLLNCLSLTEIVHLIRDEVTMDDRLREKVLARLTDDVLNASSHVSSIVQKLLKALEDNSHSKKSTAAYFLERLYDYLPSIRQRAIIYALLRSPQTITRKRAYRILLHNWHPAWKSEIQRLWNERHESECAIVIVDHFDPVFLVQHVEQLARDLDDKAQVARLYYRACTNDPGLLAKLRKQDGITYAYVSARLGTGISKGIARNLLRKYERDPRLGILVWSLGKLGQWDQLVEIATRVDTIQKEML